MTVVITSPYAPMVVTVFGAATGLVLSAWRMARSSVLASIYGLVIGAAIAGMQASLIDVTSGPVTAGPLASLPVAVCLAIGAAALAISLRTLSANGPGPRIAVLVALGSAAAAFMTAVTDVLLLFLAVETLALAGYGIVAVRNTDRAREAAMKWFVQGSVATAIFIAGLGVLSAQTGGSLAYADLAAIAAGPTPSIPLAVGFMLVLAALAFKAGAFPFHSWMPDAFETGPATGIAMLASVGKVAPLSAAALLAVDLAGPTGQRIAPVIAGLAVASIVFGNLVALRQRSLARMLAYSGVAQVGYAFVGLVLGTGAMTVIIFAALYAITSAASFLFIVAMREAEPQWNGSVAGLAGLSRRRPALAFALTAIMFSLTGIPLTAGFWGKFAVLAAAVRSGWLWLAVVAMAGSVVSFGYYGNVLRQAFSEEGVRDASEPEAEPESMLRNAPPTGGLRSPATVGTVAIAAVIVLLGVLPFLSNASSVTAFLP